MSNKFRGSRIRAPQEKSEPGLPGACGFTLLELMIVVVLIGIMAALILPEMRGTFEDALLRSTTRKLVTALNLANSQSITVNQDHRVRLDPQNGRYLIERASRNRGRGGHFVTIRNVPGATGELDKRIIIEVRRPDADPADSGTDDPPGPPVEWDAPSSLHIGFYADGTADSREIVLRDRQGFAVRLRINPTTARVRLVERAPR